MAEDSKDRAAQPEGGDVVDRILRFRRDTGLTQQALGAFLGVSQRTVSRWERGVDRPSPGLLDRLSSVVGEGEDGSLPSVFEAVRAAAVPLALVDHRGRVLVASRAYQTATGETPLADGKRLPLVLVIEDDEAVLKVTRAVLKRWRFLSVGVTQGRAAVELVAAGEAVPDIAIIDVLLPGGMDGVETAKALRRILPGLPILMITGEVSEDNQRRIAEAGLTAITKPVDPQQVRMTLMALLPDRRSLPNQGDDV